MLKNRRLLTSIVSYSDKYFKESKKLSVLENYDFKFDKVFKFYKDNSEEFKKLIKKRMIEKADYQKIKTTFDIIFDNYISSLREQYRFDDVFEEDSESNTNKLKTINYSSIDSLFIDMTKSFIALSLQQNDNIESYLKVFSPSNPYYKEMKVLALIRFSNLDINKFAQLFQEISTLLQDAIEKDPSTDNINKCIKIAIEYLNILFTTKGYSPWKRIEFINNNSTPEFIESLKFNGHFRRWFDNFENSHERLLNQNGLEDIIKEILKSNEEKKGRTVSLNEIKKTLKPYFDEYQIRAKSYKIKDIDYSALNSELSDLLPKITDLEIKYLGDGIYSTYFYFEKNKSLVDSIKERLLKHDLEEGCNIKICLLYDENKKNIGELKKNLEQIFKYTFSFFIVPNDLKELLNREREIESQLMELSTPWYTDNSELEELARDIIWKVYEICNKNYQSEKDLVIKSQSNFSEHSKTQQNTSSSNALELGDNIEEIKKLKELTSNLDSKIASLNNSIKYYLEKNRTLHEEIIYLKDLLKRNDISFEGESTELEAKERRRGYKILLVCGDAKAVKGYKNLTKKSEIWESIYNEYSLTQDNFTIDERPYTAQKNKNFSKSIEDKLDSGAIDFLIAVVTDHSTEYKLLLDSWKYKSQITYFGQMGDDGRINKDDQSFTFDKFQRYLKIAIDKYEGKINNNLLGLD